MHDGYRKQTHNLSPDRSPSASYLALSLSLSHPTPFLLLGRYKPNIDDAPNQASTRAPFHKYGLLALRTKVDGRQRAHMRRIGFSAPASVVEGHHVYDPAAPLPLAINSAEEEKYGCDSHVCLNTICREKSGHGHAPPER